MGGEVRTAEEKTAAIASRAHGIVTRGELLRAGLSGREIDRRVEKGLLIREYRGVYRVGHQAPSTAASYMAAVKACGEGAVLGGRAAGYLWGIVKGRPPKPVVLTRTERRIPHLLTRRCKRLDRRDVTEHKGIPVTTVPRTIVDLAGELHIDDLARVCHEAGVKYRTTPRQVGQALQRKPNAPGAAKLHAILGGKTPITLSIVEKRLFDGLKAAGLPLPEVNKRTDGRCLDLRWPKERLTVEVLSYRYHHSTHAWENDHRGQRLARKRRDDWRSFTYRDVMDNLEETIAELRVALRHPG
jgi:hypothetical protein